MLKSFAENLRRAVLKTGAPCVVGLDPRPDRLPRELCRGGGGLLRALGDFHRYLLDEVAGKVPCIKPQSAFFEALGPVGAGLFAATCQEAQERGLIVIGDVKRGDIGSTAEAYAQAHFPYCDALTINPYLGSDGVKPFLAWCREQGRGVFILVRTSNPGNEFQGLRTEQGTLAEVVAGAVTSWAEEPGMVRDTQNEYGPVGAVVGATHPAEIPRFRELLPHSWLLLPGYGAQGAKAGDLRAAFDAQGLGALVNSSRGITACFDPGEPEWRAALRGAVEAFRTDIREAANL